MWNMKAVSLTIQKLWPMKKMDRPKYICPRSIDAGEEGGLKIVSPIIWKNQDLENGEKKQSIRPQRSTRRACT